jgi:hypothetical protein
LIAAGASRIAGEVGLRLWGLPLPSIFPHESRISATINSEYYHYMLKIKNLSKRNHDSVVKKLLIVDIS